MASVNKCIIVGNCGRDPEQRFLQSGEAVANLAIATSYKPKDREPITEWHRVVLFGRLAEIAAQYLRKGSSVYIEGRLQTRKYADKDGVERYATEIVGEIMQLLDRPQGDGGADQNSSRQQVPQQRQQNSREQARERQHAAANGRPAPDFEDDIPFN